MSGLLFLTKDDFNIKEGSKGELLCHNIKGISLILFYSTQCPHCHTFIPCFKRLGGTIGGCQFGMINISKNREVVMMSKKTIAPIEYVPYVVLYVNGIPFMRYDGPQDEREIRNFVTDVANQLQTKEKFSSEKVKQTGKGIPAYTIGKPLVGCDGNVCYLEFDEAYTLKK